MKKIIISLAVILAGMGVSYAGSANCGGYECVEPYGMNNGFCRTIGAVSGLNSITELRLESIIRKEVLKLGHADDLKVNFDSYSTRDLKKGIFKSMQISAKNVLINDIHLSSLDLKTLCKFNYIKQVDNDVIIMEDFPMSFDVTFTPADLNKTMQHPRYKKLISDLNLILGKYAKGVKISSTKVAIKNRKFYYVIGFDVPFIRTEQKLVFQSDLCIRNGKIDLTNTHLVSGNFNLDLSKADFLVGKLNPLDFTVNILKNKNAKVTVQNLELNKEGNAISANGIVIVPKESHE